MGSNGTDRYFKNISSDISLNQYFQDIEPRQTDICAIYRGAKSKTNIHQNIRIGIDYNILNQNYYTRM